MKKFVATGLSTFHHDTNGFPLVGEVIRYYRGRMTYTNSEGKRKHWTQADLAKRLDVSEITVRLMETQHRGLDSIERRRAIALLLSIPPALLGLASLDDLEKIMQGDSPEHIAAISSTKHLVDTSEIQLYRDALGVFKDRYEQGKLQPQNIELWITRINDTLEQFQGKSKNDALAELAKYHLIAANTYSHDLQDWAKTTNHLRTTREIANILDDNELFIMSCYYTSEMYLGQGKAQLAYKELESVSNLSKSANSQIRGNILADMALTRALIDANESDRSYIRNLLDEAEKLTTESVDSTAFMKFDTVQYLECRADTLISLKRYGLALECIDDAEEYLDTRPLNIRNTEFLKILRAECYIKQRKAEHEEATRLLSQILHKNNNIQYYVDYVARLHKLIVASSYGNAPDVVDLGVMLGKAQIKH